jgi:NitT/TauT family transport system substrate-binding protein
MLKQICRPKGLSKNSLHTSVILSEAKNPAARPFASLRVTIPERAWVSRIIKSIGKVYFPTGPKLKRFAALWFCLGWLALRSADVQAEKIRTVVPQSSLNYLSVYVAESRGFFKQEGLDNEILVVSGPQATAALLSGDVDYGGGGGSAMRAAVGGAPIKGIMFQTEKVTFFLVTDPSITRSADLKGKKVGVGGIGSSQDRLILTYIEQAGLLSTDITRIALGADASRRILAIKTGVIHATMLDPGTVIFAEQQGLKVLAFLGDLFPYPFQTFATTDRKLKENPEQVKRWLRAMVNALMFVRDKPEEAADVALKRLRIGNVTKPALVEGIKRYNRALSSGVPGLPSSEGIRNALEHEVRIPLKMDGELLPERVLNLKFIQQVRMELESQKTKP